MVLSTQMHDINMSKKKNSNTMLFFFFALLQGLLFKFIQFWFLKQQ